MAALRGLSELPDAQIDDAIQRQEWTLALQLIEQKEKKLKKNEASDWLAVWSSLHCARHPTNEREI